MSDQHKAYKMRVFLLFLIFFFPATAHACSCGQSTDLASRFQRADAVILAEIKSTKLVKTTYSDHDMEYVIADISIIETFKRGKTPITKVLDLVPSVGNCSIALVSGVEYIFFVNKNKESGSEEGENVSLETNNYVGRCTGSHPVNMYHESFKNEARKLRKFIR